MKKFVLACAGFALLLASPSFGAEERETAMDKAALAAATKVSTNSNAGFAKAVATPGFTAAPITGVPPVIGNFILVGADETGDGIPCFFCAPAPGGGFGVALTIPVGYLTSDLSTIDYSYMFQNVSINANCTLAFAMMQGTTVLDAASFVFGIYPSTWVVTFPRSLPAGSGDATAYGFVMCNGVQQAVVKTRVVLQ